MLLKLLGYTDKNWKHRYLSVSNMKYTPERTDNL